MSFFIGCLLYRLLLITILLQPFTDFHNETFKWLFCVLKMSHFSRLIVYN